MLFEVIDGVGCLDREALAGWLRYLGRPAPSEVTIRRHCTPVTHDPATGRALYDVDASLEALASVTTRTRRLARRA